MTTVHQQKPVDSGAFSQIKKTSMHVFQLFINGHSLNSIEAVDTLLKICRENLNGNYQLEIIDIQKDPDKAEEAGIIAIPTLIRMEPAPVNRIIGALNVRSRVLAGLGISSMHK
ncbi:circadian clock KaiB family protein [Pontibacter sp. BT731]|nr:circadian clock KaiB family protein [Pontibacter sp. BT731]